MATLLKELQFKTQNDVGVLSEVTQALKSAHVNLLHAWACGDGPNGFFGIVTNNNERAKKALKMLGIKATEREVVSVNLPNRTGELARVAKKLASAKINVTNVVATSARGRQVSVLIGTRNNQKAKRVI